MTTPTNAPEGANVPALSAAPVLAGSTRLPNVETMTFADADAEVVALLASANSKWGKGEEAEREADFNIVVVCELRDAILSTPPRTLADALAMLNRLACKESGMPSGMIPRQDTAVALLRDFMATLATGKGVASTDALCAGEPARGVSNTHTHSAGSDETAPPQIPYPPKLLTPQSSLRGWVEADTSKPGRAARGAALPIAITAMPTDPEAIGPNAVAVAAFWESYMGMDGVVMDWMEDGDGDRLETRFAELAEEFRAAVTTAGPPVSVMDALALASLQHELLSDAVGLEPPVVFGARGVMLKAVADQLVQLAPVG